MATKRLRKTAIRVHELVCGRISKKGKGFKMQRWFLVQNPTENGGFAGYANIGCRICMVLLKN